MPRPVAVDPRFGAELRRLRERGGFTLRDLAKETLSSRGHLGDLETGRRRPTVGTASRLDQALNAGGQLAAMVREAGPPAEVAERIAYVTRHPRRADSSTLDALADLLGAQRRLEDAAGAAAVIVPVRAQVDLVTGLVGEAGGELRPRLVDLASQWAQFAGWLHAASGQPVDAGRWYAQTLEWATEVDRSDMIATALSMRGHLAWMAGQPGAVVGLSAAARRQAASPGVRALAAQQEARGFALAGDGAPVESLLDLAEQLADDPGERPPWIYFHSGAYLTMQRGLVYRLLGRHADAASRLAAGIGAQPAGTNRPEWVGPYLVHLAAALRAAGESNEAEAVLTEARMLGEATGSVRIRAAVRSLSARH
jgi:transcriptional regulator with XRE-family HTH domain